MSTALAGTLVKFTLLGCSVALLNACAAPAERFEKRARAAELVRTEVRGTVFTHLVYRNRYAPSGPRDLLIIFIDGDGTPWVKRGTEPAADPTPRGALTLDLLSKTPLPALYLTRPCYNGMTSDTGCDRKLWTHARYSQAVVDSMAAALARYVNTQPQTRLLLVGYSGGGSLATLMAPQLKNLAGVVTIAANLDTERWAQMHGYLPLTDSLNPATQPTTAGAVEIHLIGDRDVNVPPASLERYLASHPEAELWRYGSFGHVCCWAQGWPTILERILARVNADSAGGQLP